MPRERAVGVLLDPAATDDQHQFVETPLPSDGSRLDDTMAWMRRHLAEPLTLKDIAAHAGVSTRSLTRHFRRQTATTPIQWLIRTRLTAAQELLEQNRLGVHDLAVATVLDDPQVDDLRPGHKSGQCPVATPGTQDLRPE